MKADRIFLLRVLISSGFHTECGKKKQKRVDELLLARCSICGFAPFSFTQAIDRLCETSGLFYRAKSLSAPEIKVR